MRAAVIISGVVHEIAGRESELERVGAWLARPGAGALVFAGEAGIGKTTLWRRSVDDAAATGATVLVSAPSEAETALPYSALADLLSPTLPDVLPSLPTRQRRALEAALVVGEGGSDLLDERAVAFATLTAIRELAGGIRLVVAVDDVQWLDPSSSMVLAYALRRVAAEEEVRALLSVRVEAGTGADAVLRAFPDGLVETVSVGPLSLGALHRTVRVSLGTPLPRPQLLRIHDASGGRPLHALELARALVESSAQTLPGGGVDDLLRARVRALPPAARRALLLAAIATDTSLPALDVTMGGSARTELGPALGAGLVRIVDERAELSHPLLAGAALAETAPEFIRAAHLSLAADARTVEERAVHLARAADGPDAAIASSLDVAARSARGRGAPTSASELSELAASVTPPADDDARLARLLEAADAAFVAGDTERARTLFEAVAAEDNVLRYRALWRLGVLLGDTGDPQAVARLREVLGTDDPALASAAHRNLAQLLVYTGDVLAAVEQGTSAVEAARRSGSESELAYSLGMLALAENLAGRHDWRTTLESALAHERSSPGQDLDLSPSVFAADLYRLALELAAAREAYMRIRTEALDRQDVRIEAWAAYGLAQVAFLSGELDEAGRVTGELVDLAEQTGIMRLPASRCRALHTVLTGEADDARRQLADLVARCEEGEELLNLRGALGIEGQLALSLGDAEAAATALRRARLLADEQRVSPDAVVLPIADEVEALTLMGDADEATRLASTLDAIELAWAVPVAARASGLAAAARGDLDLAVSLLRSATDTEADLPLPLERARTWLALGRTLRRAKRRAEAREALTEARQRFHELGASPWAAQATRELSRVSGRAPADAGLTPTERRLAALVAEGRSNKEAAAALFVSVKTVEVTLTRVYRKLGVRGRSELAARYDELLKT
ncbi:MAG TPA: LuxR family transcriptional regulator [Gaiellaceae bacterium]|nr:LuxR family transcriptional regulator [Gaiellaceae bacterium]